MQRRLYREDPLSPEEREEFERDLIGFCDRELERLGDIRGLDVLYAGGSSLLWIEGLSQRIGRGGTLTALDSDARRLEDSRAALPDADLASPVRLMAGDVYEPPFEAGTFDFVYSAGLFHELDVGKRSTEAALGALLRIVRPGGRVATSDFVDTVPAVQIEDEELQRELTRERTGAMLYGIQPPGRLVSLHETVLTRVEWDVAPPFEVRHLAKIVLDEELSFEGSGADANTVQMLNERHARLRERIRREGYTRPATLYVEGRVRGGGLRRS